MAFAAQIVVAFFLGLRTEDHVDGKMLWGDVYPQEDGSVEFLLAPGKSVRRYRRTAIAARSGVLSAIDWLSRLAELTPPEARVADEPIFSTLRPASATAPAAYVPLPRSTFISRFKEAVRVVLKVDPVLYAGYSLRRGGVTEMLLSGVPVPMEKRHVGWAPGSATETSTPTTTIMGASKCACRRHGWETAVLRSEVAGGFKRPQVFCLLRAPSSQAHAVGLGEVCDVGGDSMVVVAVVVVMVHCLRA